MLAGLTMLTLRFRRFSNRTLSATIAAIVAVGWGCGSEDAPDRVTAPGTESISAPDHPLPPIGTAHVEYIDGFVTVSSNGSLQLAVLEQLAKQADFAIAAGRVDAKPITLQFERVALVDAIALILDGITYRLEYDIDAASGTRFLSLVAIGNAREYQTADSEKAATSAKRGGERVESIEDASEALSEDQAEMLEALDDPDPEARIDAVFWIDLEGGALEQLVSMLESDPDAEVRASIVDRLGDEESPAAIAAVTTALRDREPEVVLRAIEVLEFEGGDWLIPELERLLSHPDPEIREAAEDSLLYLE